MHLLVTIFSCGLIHIWCLNEYFWQQNSVCWAESKYTTVCVHGYEGTCHPPATVRLTDVFVFNSVWTVMELYGKEE